MWFTLETLKTRILVISLVRESFATVLVIIVHTVYTTLERASYLY